MPKLRNNNFLMTKINSKKWLMKLTLKLQALKNNLQVLTLEFQILKDLFKILKLVVIESKIN